MITDALIGIIYATIWLFTFPIRQLPNVALNSEIEAAMSEAGGYLGLVNQVFPVSTLLAIFGVVLSIEAAIFLYKIVMWIIRKIPGIS